MKLKKLVLSGLATTAAFGVFASQVHADEIEADKIDPKEVLGATEDDKDVIDQIDKGGSKIEDLIKLTDEDQIKKDLADAKAEAKKEFAGNEEALKQIEAAPTLYDLEVVLTSLRNPERTELKELIEKVSKQEEMTIDVHNALDEAKAVLNKEDASVKEIKEAHTALQAALDGKEEGEETPEEVKEDNETGFSTKEAAEKAAKEALKDDKVNKSFTVKLGANGRYFYVLSPAEPETDNEGGKEEQEIATLKAELKKLVEKADGFKTVTIDLYNANKEAKALLEKEDATLAELKAAFTKLEKEISIKEDLDKKENDKEETEKPQTDAEKEVAELKKWVKYADSLKKMTIDVHNALDEAKALLKKENISYDEAHKALEKLFFALEDANLLPKEDEKPNKPEKDITDLIDWDKLKDLIAKKDDKKPGKKEEEVKKGKKEAKKLPQTGAVASVAPAALGLALAAVGAGFAFRKQD